MKKFLEDGRLTPLSSTSPPPHPLAHPPITHRPPYLGVGNGGGRRVRQGNTSPTNITTVVEMQCKPLPLSPVCPICLHLCILFSILSFIILCLSLKMKQKGMKNYLKEALVDMHCNQFSSRIKCGMIFFMSNNYSGVAQIRATRHRARIFTFEPQGPYATFLFLY